MEGVVWKKHGVRAGLVRRSVLGWGQVSLSCFLPSPVLSLPLPCGLSCLYVLPFPVVPYF
jgi:hypothetical protein